jgi:Subtilase family
VQDKALSCKSLDPNDFLPDAVKAYQSNYRGPYLADQSVSATHGTHVAGIVAKQDPRIGIVPVRVTTEYVALPESKLNALEDSFVSMMKAWIADPVVQSKMKMAFQKVISVSQKSAREVSGVRELTDVEYEAKFIDFWKPRIHGSVFQKQSIEHLFIEELKEAIARVGQSGIKVANISLGTSFASVPETLNVDPETELDKSFVFLKYEVFKHSIAKVLNEKAPGTLFVVAAGNEGKWVDGESRIALPCDVSSPYFESAEKALNKKIANNSVQNILCVGSVSHEGKISSFSNITLTNVPFVFSYGEAIESALRLGDCKGPNQNYLEKASLGLQFPRLEESELVDGFLNLVKFVKTEPNPRLKRVDEFNRIMQDVGNSLPYVTSDTFCYTSQKSLFAKQNSGALSGTSMASPAVAGVTARLLIQKIEKDLAAKGQSWADIDQKSLYAKPEYQPKILIQDLQAVSQKFGGSGLIRDTSVVTDVLPWDTSAPLVPIQPDLRLNWYRGGKAE